MQIYEIELNNQYANQEFDVNIPGKEAGIHVLLQTNENNSLLMSIFINDVQLGIPFICCPNQQIVPYPYMVNLLGGNFIFETNGDNYPDFEDFGKSCKLYFIAADGADE